MEFLKLGAEQLREAIVGGDLSCKEVVEGYLRQIEKWNPEINAFVRTNPKAVEEAQQVDERLSSGGAPRLLEGVPVAVKDMLCTKDLETTAGSKMLEGFVPPYSATVVERLRSAGAIVLGKCNQDEFAMGSSNEASYFGACKNPWDLERVPGGSSGGSAAAVAALMAPVSIGTDTGGSIRQPASFCGLVGVKPTYGRVSRYGIIAFASSLDQAGPMTTSVGDAAMVMEAICGHDPRDATTSQQQIPEWSNKLRAAKLNGLSGLKVGLPRAVSESKLHPDVSRLVATSLDMLKAAGAEVVDVELKMLKYSVPVYYMVATSEASSNLARYDGVRYGYRADFSELPAQDLDEFYSRTRGQGFGSEVKRRIMLGTFALSSGYYEAYYRKACQVRRLISEDYAQAFEKCDVLLSPSSPAPAFKLGEKIKDPVKMYQNDRFTTAANLAGLPGMSVPVGFSDEGLPIGMQLNAPQFCEQQMLNAGLALEEAANIKGSVANAIR